MKGLKDNEIRDIANELMYVLQYLNLNDLPINLRATIHETLADALEIRNLRIDAKNKNTS